MSCLGFVSLYLLEFAPQVIRSTSTELVKDVVVPLLTVLAHNSCSFQQVVRDVAADDAALGVEVDLDELSEPRRVVVTRGLGISESLQNRVGVENL